MKTTKPSGMESTRRNSTSAPSSALDRPRPHLLLRLHLDWPLSLPLAPLLRLSRLLRIHIINLKRFRFQVSKHGSRACTRMQTYPRHPRMHVARPNTPRHRRRPRFLLRARQAQARARCAFACADAVAVAAAPAPAAAVARERRRPPARELRLRPRRGPSRRTSQRVPVLLLLLKVRHTKTRKAPPPQQQPPPWRKQAQTKRTKKKQHPQMSRRHRRRRRSDLRRRPKSRLL